NCGPAPSLRLRSRRGNLGNPAAGSGAIRLPFGTRRVRSSNLRQPCYHYAIPRCSSLQRPKNAPCSLSREAPYNALTPLRNLKDSPSTLPAISENLAANRKLQGELAAETVSLLTPFSATQSGLHQPTCRSDVSPCVNPLKSSRAAASGPK